MLRSRILLLFIKKKNLAKKKNKMQNLCVSDTSPSEELPMPLVSNESDECEKPKVAFREIEIENESLKNEIESLKNELTRNSQTFVDYEQRIKELLLYKERSEIYQGIAITLENDKKELLDENKSFETKYDELKKKCEDQNVNLQELKQKKEYFESQYNKLEQQLKERRSQIRSLKQANNNLEDEASKYQSALGIATNLNSNDDNQNYNVKLNKDILELHDTLENYVTNLKPKIDVNVNEAKKLLLKYGCQTEITDKEPNKPLIKAVLQRHVLEEILDQANFYFTRSEKEHYLESDIVNETKALTDLMEKFYNNRFGDDEITRLTPIRLRQQVYAALGTRGFNDIKKSDSENSKHNFIIIISKKINGMMNKYRVIKDTEKRRYVNALAEDLVRNVVKIFYFYLLIQEPRAQYRWLNNNEKINKFYMKGSWDEDEIENMVVEVCSFPLIFKPSVSGGVKICTPAKVFSRHYTNQGFLTNMGRKLKNLVTTIPSLYTGEYDFEQTSSSDSDESSLPTETNNTNILNKLYNV